MARRGFAKTIGLLLVAVVVIGFLAYALTRPAIGWPSEARRVVHPGGFSVVMPPDWEQHLTGGADAGKAAALQMLPSKPVGNPGTFIVARTSKPATEDALKAKGYKASTFQGKPAYDKWKIDKTEMEHTRSVVFERDGVWYDITLRRSQSEPLDTGAWLKYAESFRVEPVRTPPAIHLTTMPLTLTTRPATAPTP